MPKKARILQTIEALGYYPNQAVEFPDDIAKTLQAEGYIDTAPAAVQYALDNGAELQTYKTPAQRAADDEARAAHLQAVADARAAVEAARAAVNANQDPDKRDALAAAVVEAEKALAALAG